MNTVLKSASCRRMIVFTRYIILYFSCMSGTYLSNCALLHIRASSSCGDPVQSHLTERCIQFLRAHHSALDSSLAVVHVTPFMSSVETWKLGNCSHVARAIWWWHFLRRGAPHVTTVEYMYWTNFTTQTPANTLESRPVSATSRLNLQLN